MALPTVLFAGVIIIASLLYFVQNYRKPKVFKKIIEVQLNGATIGGSGLGFYETPSISLGEIVEKIQNFYDEVFPDPMGRTEHEIIIRYQIDESNSVLLYYIKDRFTEQNTTEECFNCKELFEDNTEPLIPIRSITMGDMVYFPGGYILPYHYVNGNLIKGTYLCLLFDVPFRGRKDIVIESLNGKFYSFKNVHYDDIIIFS